VGSIPTLGAMKPHHTDRFELPRTWVLLDPLFISFSHDPNMMGILTVEWWMGGNIHISYLDRNWEENAQWLTSP
jgi:hypothetical protein